eukprot:2859682-Rhodomonas_salina.2
MLLPGCRKIGGRKGGKKDSDPLVSSYAPAMRCLRWYQLAIECPLEAPSTFGLERWLAIFYTLVRRYSLLFFL